MVIRPLIPVPAISDCSLSAVARSTERLQVHPVVGSPGSLREDVIDDLRPRLPAFP